MFGNVPCLVFTLTIASWSSWQILNASSGSPESTWRTCVSGYKRRTVHWDSIHEHKSRGSAGNLCAWTGKRWGYVLKCNLSVQFCDLIGKHPPLGVNLSSSLQDVYQAHASPSNQSKLHCCEGQGHGGHHTRAWNSCGQAWVPEGGATEQTQHGQAAHYGSRRLHTIQDW